jgi:hypothetical protein
MITVLLSIAVAIATLAVFALKQAEPENPLSFYESMKLCNLPIITMKVGGEDINFLLDTGSMESIMDKRVLELFKLPHTPHEKTFDMYGVTGNTISVPSVLINLEYKGVTYEGHFMVKDLGDSMDMVKQEYGVRIHGVLGAKFFDKYSYVLDFANLIAYTRRKNSLWKKLSSH